MIVDNEKVQDAKAKLGSQSAQIIADLLKVEQYNDRNLKGCCPVHKENTPSFIWNAKANNFRCFGCGITIDIIDAYMRTGDTYLQAVQKLFELTGTQYTFGEMGVKTRKQYYYPNPIYAPDNEKVYDYLSKRKISRETADYLSIRQDKDGNLLYQYYDSNDVLTMVKVRKSSRVNHGEVKCWYLKDSNGKPFDTSNILYNMNRVGFDKPLLITSGEGDCAAAIEAGYINSVSIPMGDQNTRWVEECLEFLDNFNSIIICPDNDESGMKYCKDITPRLGSWRCKVANVPNKITLQDGTVKIIKDLNELLYFCGKDAVLEIITNAKDTPVPSVDDLSDITDIDLDEIDGVTTGIEVLDKELMRIFFGTLTIISGMPGSGKSSLITQLICNALDQNKNCWLFSGELPSFMTKNWFNYILAGNRNITRYEQSNGDTFYKVTNEAKKAIDKYYRGKWYIYKDDYDNNIDKLIDSMTDVVRKYGVKLLVLDNMMVIDTEDNENELKEQTNTIKKLIAFSKKYNVATILVCHPRKLKETATVGMYDIAGTSNITNLAHRTIGMRRVTQDEKEGEDKFSNLKKSLVKYDVIINIIKDRLRGRSNISRGLYYDTPSRRFFTNYNEYDYKYSWDTKAYTDILPYPITDKENEVFGEIKK